MKFVLVFAFALTIVGAKEGDHPSYPQYMVKLEVSKAGHCSICSGSFINKRFILTAAHCVFGMDSVIAYVGPPFEGNCSTGYEISRNSIIVHESFREMSNFVYQYDIALIKFTWKTSCRPIKPVRFLNEKPSQFHGFELVEFVRFSSSCGQSPTSLSVHSVIGNLNELFAPGGFEGRAEEKVLRVSLSDYGRSCNGDTSGHLITPNTNGELIGIMTNPREEDCGRNETRTTELLFTHVNQYKSWIIDSMKAVRFSSKRSMVRLNISHKDECSVCSGSFVHKNWILTSAHCVIEADSVIVDVRRHFNSSCSSTYAINKSEIIIHPFFNMKYDILGHLTTQSHDIALIKFVRETSCKQYWIADLPGGNVPSEFYNGASSQLIRFGESCPSQPALSTKLLRVVENDRCRARAKLIRIGQLEVRKPIDEDQMCVFTGLSAEFCIGDTSGRLFKKGTAELIGIMSRQPHQRCLHDDHVTFTRIAYYDSWIKAHWTDTKLN